MKRDDDVLEENHVFISERDGESTNDTGQNVQKLSGTIEFVGFMDESEKALVNGLSDHLSSWHKLSVQVVENIRKIVPLDGFFGIEELQELLHKLWGDVNFERSYLYSLVDYELQKELVDTLEMWPSWIYLIFLLDTCF